MKRLLALVLSACLLLAGCASGAAGKAEENSILATTAPVAEIVRALTDGTPYTCTQLISEPVSCLHDYSLSVEQMKNAEQARLIVQSGFSLEDFMQDVLAGHETVLSLSDALTPLPGEEGADPHWWLDPSNMALAAAWLAERLGSLYPDCAAQFSRNADAFGARMQELCGYASQTLGTLRCRELVTFHDGFSYFADAFGLTVAAALEVESGSEPSARDLEQIIALIRADGIPAIFTEKNGDTAAAGLVAEETGVGVYTLDMAMELSAQSYYDVMKANLDTVRDALQ